MDTIIKPSVLPVPGVSGDTSVVQAIKEQPRESDTKLIAMTNEGLTDELLFKVAGEGLRACVYEKNKYNGQMVETDIPNHTIRFKFWEGLMRIKGYLGTGSGDDNSVNFNFTIQQREEIKSRLMARFRGVLDV